MCYQSIFMCSSLTSTWCFRPLLFFNAAPAVLVPSQIGIARDDPGERIVAASPFGRSHALVQQRHVGDQFPYANHRMGNWFGLFGSKSTWDTPKASIIFISFLSTYVRLVEPSQLSKSTKTKTTIEPPSTFSSRRDHQLFLLEIFQRQTPNGAATCTVLQRPGMVIILVLRRSAASSMLIQVYHIVSCVSYVQGIYIYICI